MKQGVCGECHCIVPLTHWLGHLEWHKGNMLAHLANIPHPLGGKAYSLEQATAQAGELAARIQLLEYV